MGMPVPPAMPLASNAPCIECPLHRMPLAGVCLLPRWTDEFRCTAHTPRSCATPLAALSSCLRRMADVMLQHCTGQRVSRPWALGCPAGPLFLCAAGFPITVLKGCRNTTGLNTSLSQFTPNAGAYIKTVAPDGQPSGSGLSSAATAGIAVGACCGAGLVAAGAVLLAQRRRRARLALSHPTSSELKVSSSQQVNAAVCSPGRAVPQLFSLSLPCCTILIRPATALNASCPLPCRWNMTMPQGCHRRASSTQSQAPAWAPPFRRCSCTKCRQVRGWPADKWTHASSAVCSPALHSCFCKEAFWLHLLQSHHSCHTPRCACTGSLFYSALHLLRLTRCHQRCCSNLQTCKTCGPAASSSTAV